MDEDEEEKEEKSALDAEIDAEMYDLVEKLGHFLTEVDAKLEEQGLTIRRPFIGQYILDENHQPVPMNNTLTWALWFEHTANRIVRQECVGMYYVSTVFLGLDHNFHRFFREEIGASYRPILFETMVFAKVGNERRLDIQERCATWDEAVEQHEQMVAKFKNINAG